MELVSDLCIQTNSKVVVHCRYFVKLTIGDGRVGRGRRGSEKRGERGGEKGGEEGGEREGKGGEGMCINTQFYNHPMNYAVKPSNTQHT